MLRAFVVAVVMAGAAHADANPAVRFVSEGDACDVTPVPDRVRALLGRDPFDARAVAEVSVQLSRRGARVFADVTFEDANGSHRGPRRIDATRCDALLDSIALAIALGMPADAPSPVSEPPVPMPEVRELDVRLALGAPPIKNETSTREVAVMAGGAAGLSSNGWRQAMTVGVRWRRDVRSMALEMSIATPDERVVGAMGRVQISTAKLSAVGCRHAGELSLCGALGMGATHGSTTGLFDAHDAITPVVSVGARLGWEHGVWGGFRARLEFAADGNLTRTRFAVDHMSVWSTSRFEAWASAGMIARFL